jgi:cytoskeleton protein RodZ
MARTSKESDKTATEKKAAASNKPSSENVAIPTPSSVQDSHASGESIVADYQIYRSRCGGALRASREKQGLSVQDVANRLKISVKQIEALEADNFEGLPEPTIVRGFIRNYAKHLKLNSEPLIDAYIVMVPNNLPYELTVKSATNMKMNSSDKPKTSIYLWFGLGAVLLAVLWIFYQQYIQKPSPIEPTNPVAESAQPVEPLPEVALPAIDRETIDVMDQALSLHPDNSAIVPEVASPSLLTEGATPNSSTSTTTETAITKTQSEVVPKPATDHIESTITEPISASVPNEDIARLEISATQQTWINVVDASGKEIYSKILYEGNRELIEAKPPLKLTVGNASATKVTFNGKSQDLAPHTNVNVARITLK